MFVGELKRVWGSDSFVIAA
jgi:hypothetical protein